MTIFEEKIQELTTSTDENGNITAIPLTEEGVEMGLNAVSATVFPYRALKTQKQWMHCKKRKPKQLSIQRTIVAISRLNNSLPLFPNATDKDMFTPKELLELCEWLVPDAWRTKFDLDGYVPTDFDKERFIRECEAIERNEPKTVKKSSKETLNKKIPAHKKSQGVKHRSSSHKSETSKYFCTEHGNNHIHSTDKCFTLKNRKDKEKGPTGLTKKSFRKEINSLTKGGQLKKKILEMFAHVLKDERVKLAKQKAHKAKKAKKTVIADSSDSDSCDMSVDNIELELGATDQADRKTDETDEDQTYLDRIENLGSTTRDN